MEQARERWRLEGEMAPWFYLQDAKAARPAPHVSDRAQPASVFGLVEPSQSHVLLPDYYCIHKHVSFLPSDVVDDDVVRTLKFDTVSCHDSASGYAMCQCGSY